MDLLDPAKKMSKSAANKNGVIFLTDTQEEVEKKIKIALTDSLNKVKYDLVNQPAISNLIKIYGCLSGLSIPEIEEKFADIPNYGVFKKDLSAVIDKFITDFQTKYAQAVSNFANLNKIVREIGKDLNLSTQKKIQDVYEKIGLR
jgi:tryptophanyl-tRNA synthetase